MNFDQYKLSLKYKNYNIWKICLRYCEYKIKNFFVFLIIKFNRSNVKSKKIIDIGNFKDSSYINFFIYSLKDEFIFSYDENDDSPKLFKRLGLINFFKNTVPNSKVSFKNKIKINMHSSNDKDQIFIDTNYFKYFQNKEDLEKNNRLIMPYFMYPRIYNSFYKKINIIKKPDLNLRIFFSGSIVKEGYNSFNWKNDGNNFPNRIEIINNILKEFKSEIYVIKTKSDLKSNKFNKKKIILCLHDKMIRKTSYILNFNENFNLLSNSCFNLNCPGVVMPLSHHLIEGMKVGSIPITGFGKLIDPFLNSENSLEYKNLTELNKKIEEALNMNEEKILYMRKNVTNYYNDFLSPNSFRLKFKKIIEQKEKKIICCDDHRSIR